MLQQPKSSKSHLFKYALLLPLLAVFMFTFNATTVYVDRPVQTNMSNLLQDQNVLRFTISKTTSDKQLNTITELLKKEGATVTFEGVERDKNEYITAIEMKYSSKSSSGNFTQNGDEPITDIILEVDRSTKKISFKSTNNNMSQKFKVEGDKPLNKVETDTLVFITRDSSNIHVIHPKKGSQVYFYKSDSPSSYNIVQMDSTKNYVVWNSGQNATGLNDDQLTFAASGDSQIIWHSDSTSTIKGNKVILYNSSSSNQTKSPKALQLYTTTSDKAHGIANHNGKAQTTSTYTIRNSGSGNQTALVIRDGKALNTFKIDKDTKKSQLDKLIQKLDDQGIDVKFSKVRRNQDGEITQIKISLENDNGNKASAINKDEDGISDILFGQNGDGLFIKSN